MSDNLKIAKECGAEYWSSYSSPIHMTQQVLDIYTSRILASQQAAHDAEIAKLKEEIARLRDLLAQPVHSHY